jgi:hypothetical protein
MKENASEVGGNTMTKNEGTKLTIRPPKGELNGFVDARISE